MDRVDSEHLGQRGGELDQLLNRRLHLLTAELALAFNSCQGCGCEPLQEWIEPYRELRSRYRALYPALQAIDEETPR